MSQYHQNFDEFGQLREDHSPWTLGEVARYASGFLYVVAIASGVLV